MKGVNKYRNLCLYFYKVNFNMYWGHSPIIKKNTGAIVVMIVW